MIHGKCVYAENIENSFQLTEDSPYLLVTSPAFLKRIDESVLLSNTATLAFSSGGELNKATHDQVIKTMTVINEIYGSTETGGIAFRRQQETSNWELLDGVSIHQNEDGQTILTSSFIDTKNIVLDDEIEIINDKLFTLNGRKDSTVKIEDKRINLKQIEALLLQHRDIADCFLLKEENNQRQYLRYFLVLHKESELNTKNENIKTMQIRSYLSQFLDALFIPKSFYFLDALPYNNQAKINKKDIYEIINRQN